MTKYIFVTGGVVSSLGKGIASASIGRLLESRGLKVTIAKFDPYLNVDPGTMSPYQHGEVFVLDDGAETDLDLGHYERFLSVKLTRNNNVTSGKIYNAVISKEMARPIMVLVVIASVLAAVGSYFAIDEWLTSFAYKAGINPLFFVLALVVAAGVAFLTVALQSWKTASADPVNALRNV